MIGWGGCDGRERKSGLFVQFTILCQGFPSESPLGSLHVTLPSIARSPDSTGFFFFSLRCPLHVCFRLPLQWAHQVPKFRKHPCDTVRQSSSHESSLQTSPRGVIQCPYEDNGFSGSLRYHAQVGDHRFAEFSHVTVSRGHAVTGVVCWRRGLV